MYTYSSIQNALHELHELHEPHEQLSKHFSLNYYLECYINEELRHRWRNSPFLSLFSNARLPRSWIPKLQNVVSIISGFTIAAIFFVVVTKYLTE